MRDGDVERFTSTLGRKSLPPDAKVRLTSIAAAGLLPESMQSLPSEDWRAIMGRGDEATTQAMGRAAHQAGTQALLVPSKPDPNGINLLVFPDRLTKKSQLEVLNADALDKLGRAS